MGQIGRRRFLLLAAGTAAGGAAGYFGGGLASAGQLAQLTRTTRALGTEVSLAVRHPRPAAAERAIAAAFAELELVERLMSIYRPDSQLSRLNRDGVLEQPHPHLVAVLRQAQQTS